MKFHKYKRLEYLLKIKRNLIISAILLKLPKKSSTIFTIQFNL